MDASLILNEQQIAAARSSVKRVKKRLHDTELTLILEPPKNELAEREEWRLKVTELIERKEKLPFPSLKEISHDLEQTEKVQRAEQQRVAQEELKRRKPRPVLTDEEKLEQVKRIELKRRIDPNCKFFGPSEEGVPLRTIDHYSGCNTIYAGRRTLVRRNPKVEVFASTMSSLPPWFGPGYYKDADPALFSSLKETSYQVWVKAQERSGLANADYLRHKKVERSLMKNPVRADPPFCTQRMSGKNQTPYTTEYAGAGALGSSVASTSSFHPSWAGTGMVDQQGSLGSFEHYSSLSGTNPGAFPGRQKKAKPPGHNSSDSISYGIGGPDEAHSVMAATLPTIDLNSLVAKIERYQEKQYKTQDYSLGALSTTKMKTSDELFEEEKARKRAERAAKNKPASPTAPVAGAAAASAAPIPGDKQPPFDASGASGASGAHGGGFDTRRMSTLGLPQKGRKPSSQKESSAAFLATEFLRKQRTSVQESAAGRKMSVVMSSRRASMVPGFAAIAEASAAQAAPPVATTAPANVRATLPGGTHGLVGPSQPHGPSLSDPFADIDGPVISRPTLFIDPLALDEGNYSFAHANRSNPDFYVLHPKSPWLKTRSPAFEKASQGLFRPFVSPIKNALKKKALKSTAELLLGTSPTRRRRLRIRADGDGDGDDSDDDDDEEEESSATAISETTPFVLPNVDEDLRPLVKKWYADNRVYSPAKPQTKMRTSGSLALVGDAVGPAGPGGEELSSEFGMVTQVTAVATAGLTGAAHAQAQTWSSKVKAIPRYSESPTGRSTLALRGTNGLLLEDLAAAHLRSKLTHGNPDEFDALVNEEMVEEASKQGSGSGAGWGAQSTRRASVSVRMQDGGGADNDGGDGPFKPQPLTHAKKSSLFTKSGKIDLKTMSLTEEAEGEWDL